MSGKPKMIINNIIVRHIMYCIDYRHRGNWGDILVFCLWFFLSRALAAISIFRQILPHAERITEGKWYISLPSRNPIIPRYASLVIRYKTLNTHTHSRIHTHTQIFPHTHTITSTHTHTQIYPRSHAHARAHTHTHKRAYKNSTYYII